MGIGEVSRQGAEGVIGGMSLERAKRERKDFEGGIGAEVAGLVLGVPQHASLGGILALRATFLRATHYVPPEELLGTPLRNTLRIRRPKLDSRGP